MSFISSAIYLVMPTKKSLQLLKILHINNIRIWLFQTAAHVNSVAIAVTLIDTFDNFKRFMQDLADAILFFLHCSHDMLQCFLTFINLVLGHTAKGVKLIDLVCLH